MQPDKNQQPDQSAPPPAPPPVQPQVRDKNPYDFITNPEYETPKGGFFNGKDKSTKRIIVVAAILGIVLLVVLILSMLLGSRVTNKDQLISLAQNQNELIRVADIGVKKARDMEAKNLASTAKSTFTTQQKPLIDALAKQNVKINNKLLGQSKDTKTDEKLTAAEQANNFDEVFISVLKSELKAYQAELKAAYDNTSQKSIKTLLAEQYQNASVFIQQEVGQ